MNTKRPRSAAGSRPTLRISGPGELLQAVPYLLGFHPRASLVLVGLRHVGAAKELVVTARLDLDDAIDPELLTDTVCTLRDGGTDEIVSVLYDDLPVVDPHALPWLELAAGVTAEIERAGCEPSECVLVVGDRWWSYDCTDPRCCPAAGRPIPDDVSAFAAAATFAGVVALPDRESLVDQLAPLPDAQRAALAPHIEAAERATVAAVLDEHAEQHARALKRILFTAARAAADPRHEPLGDAAAGQLLVALAGTAFRDAIWLAVDHGKLDGRALWRDLARRAPAPYAATPLFLFGWASWRAGNGALAAIAVERVVQCDPRYSAADLLAAALRHGVDPRRLPKLRLPRSA